MQIYNEDKGLDFGKWNDPTSKLIYYDSVKEILQKINIPKKVADFGGGNGILKNFIPNIITIDIDPTKKPDVIDNILTHTGTYDLIIIRFVLHYLNDYEIIQLFNNLKSSNILVIQFINNDLLSKYENSINEFKYFRTENQLEALIPLGEIIYQKEYIVTKEFYKNRLNNNNAIQHKEIIKAYYYEHN